MHPLSLGFEDLLDNITHATMTALMRTDIDGNLLDFLSCIGWTTGTSAAGHHFIVRYVVTHVEHFFRLETIVGHPLLETADFHGHSRKHVVEP